MKNNVIFTIPTWTKVRLTSPYPDLHLKVGDTAYLYYRELYPFNGPVKLTTHPMGHGYFTASVELIDIEQEYIKRIDSLKTKALDILRNIEHVEQLLENHRQSKEQK